MLASCPSQGFSMFVDNLRLGPLDLAHGLGVPTEGARYQRGFQKPRSISWPRFLEATCPASMCCGSRVSTFQERSPPWTVVCSFDRRGVGAQESRDRQGLAASPT